MSESHPHTVYVIAGATACGKTKVAIQLARELGTSIISADSRQCYQNMAIGTAQPTAAERAEIKHYFIDAFPVTTEISAADYEQLSLSYLDEVFATNPNAIVCGGTGLYIKALCSGLDEMPGVDNKIAKQVNDLYIANGTEWLKASILKEDPLFAQNGEIQNPARMIRALIFVRSTGKSILQYRTGKAKPRPFNIVKVALDVPRQKLYERINNRVEDMMAMGLLAEAKALYPLRHLKNLHTVGYAELFNYWDGQYTLPEAIEKIKQHTRHYAKRQLTWFQKDEEFTWLSPDENIVKNILALKKV